MNSFIKPSTRLNCHQYLILVSHGLPQLYFLLEYFKVNSRYHVTSSEIPTFAFKKDVFLLIKTTVPLSHLTKLTRSYLINKTFFSSVAQSCPTLCDPMNRSTPGLPVHHQLPEFTQTHVHQVGDAMQPSHPLSSPLLLPLIPPSIRVFSNESTLRMRWPKYWSLCHLISV